MIWVRDNRSLQNSTQAQVILDSCPEKKNMVTQIEELLCLVFLRSLVMILNSPAFFLEQLLLLCQPLRNCSYETQTCRDRKTSFPPSVTDYSKPRLPHVFEYPHKWNCLYLKCVTQVFQWVCMEMSKVKDGTLSCWRSDGLTLQQQNHRLFWRLEPMALLQVQKRLC